MVPAGFYSDTCLAPSEESGMHAAHWPHTGRANDRPGAGNPRASELFFSTSCNIVLSRLSFATNCFKRLFLPGCPPGPIPSRRTATSNDKGLLADPYRPDQLRHRHPSLGLLYHGRYLLYGKSLLLHGKSLSFSQARFCRRLTLPLVQNSRG
jgi:hypothetical protein